MGLLKSEKRGPISHRWSFWCGKWSSVLGPSPRSDSTLRVLFSSVLVCTRNDPHQRMEQRNTHADIHTNPTTQLVSYFLFPVLFDGINMLTTLTLKRSTKRWTSSESLYCICCFLSSRSFRPDLISCISLSIRSFSAKLDLSFSSSSSFSAAFTIRSTKQYH